MPTKIRVRYDELLTALQITQPVSPTLPPANKVLPDEP